MQTKNLKYMPKILTHTESSIRVLQSPYVRSVNLIRQILSNI